MLRNRLQQFTIMFHRDLSGNIDLLSHANQGTSFTISLPFEIPLTQIL
jgi:chemotaxis protein histidine kinase CheA